MRRSLLLSQIACCLLAGEPSPEQIVVRCTRTFGRAWRWLPGLAKRYVKHFAEKTRPRQREVVEFLCNDRKFQKLWLEDSRGWSIAQWITEPQKMQPVAAAQGWQLPVIESVDALGEWLDLDAGDLEWFSDLGGLTHRGSPQLSHYSYRVLDKQYGLRLIEAPKTRLKKLQRQI